IQDGPRGKGMRKRVAFRLGAAVLVALCAGWSMAGCTAPGEAPASDQGSPATTAAVPIAGAISNQPVLRVATTTAGPATTRLDKALVQQALHRGELMVELPDGTRYPVAMEREQAETAGRTTFIGKVRTPFGLQSAVLTFGPDAVFGVLP